MKILIFYIIVEHVVNEENEAGHVDANVKKDKRVHKLQSGTSISTYRTKRLLNHVTKVFLYLDYTHFNHNKSLLANVVRETLRYSDKVTFI